MKKRYHFAQKWWAFWDLVPMAEPLKRPKTIKIKHTYKETKKLIRSDCRISQKKPCCKFWALKGQKLNTKTFQRKTRNSVVKKAGKPHKKKRKEKMSTIRSGQIQHCFFCCGGSFCYFLKGFSDFDEKFS